MRFFIPFTIFLIQVALAIAIALPSYSSEDIQKVPGAGYVVYGRHIATEWLHCKKAEEDARARANAFCERTGHKIGDWQVASCTQQPAAALRPEGTTPNEGSGPLFSVVPARFTCVDQ